MTYIITDETTQIKIVASNGLEWNIDKDDCLVLKVPAKTKDNVTTKDKLYIGNDGQWPLQLFYDEVTVDGDTPTDIDDFENMVNTILQNNGSGGAADLEDTNSRVATVALLADGGSGIDLGKTYFINDIGSTIPGVEFIKLTPAYGKDSGDTIKIFSSNAEAYVTALSRYVPCTYDVATNTLSGQYILYAAFITQSGTAAPTIFETRINILGETPTFTYGGTGTYKLVVTNAIFDEYKFVPFAGLVVSAGSASLVNGLAVTLSYSSATELDIGSGAVLTANSDDVLNKTYIEIKQCF